MAKAVKKKAKIGRPSAYSQAIADEICLRLSEGESLRKICASNHIPSLVTVWTWMNKHEDFLKQYTRAKEEQAELFAEEIIEIADQPMPLDAMGKIDAAAVNQARLRVDARKWVASKLKPKKYGDSTTLKGDKENPIVITHDQFIASLSK